MKGADGFKLPCAMRGTPMSFPGSNHVREYPDQLDHKHYAQSMIDEGVARYKLAALLASGVDVLDIACGSGYGPEIFSAAGARSVYAVDFDREAIEYCEWHFKRTKVKYLVMDGRQLRFVPEAFDVVVNHGSLQFDEPPDQNRLLSEISRVLRADGVAMCSVNYNVYTGPDKTGAHPFHKWAFNWPGIHDLFFPHFAHVWVFVQRGVEFIQSGHGTSWIVVASNHGDAFARAKATLEPYVGGGKSVDLEPTWRGAV